MLVGWLTATAVGYGVYQASVTRAYHSSPQTHARLPAEQVRSRFEKALAGQVGQGRPLLVHFSRPDCHCHDDSLNHIDELTSQYDPLAVVRLAHPDTGASPSREALLHDAAHLWTMVPSVPAAAVLDDRGQLVYLGPYSSGPVCGSGIEFVGKTLQALAQSSAPELWVNDLAFGCFCASGTYQRT